MNTLLAAFVATLVSWAQPHDPGRVLTVEQTLCLTQAVYYESRGEGAPGMAAVAYVALNLTVKRDKAICRMVHQPGIFSYYSPTATLRPREAASWVRAAFISVYAQLGLIPNPIGNATMYNSEKMPSWTREAQLTHRLKRHYFYTRFEDVRAPPLWRLRPATTGPLVMLDVACLLSDPGCGPLHTGAPLRTDPRLIALIECETGDVIDVNARACKKSATTVATGPPRPPDRHHATKSASRHPSAEARQVVASKTHRTGGHRSRPARVYEALIKDTQAGSEFFVRPKGGELTALRPLR